MDMRSVRMESKVKVGDKEVVRRNVSVLSHRVPYLPLLGSNKGMSPGIVD